MRCEVTVQISGADILAGTLFTYARRRVESASFSYDASYVAHPHAFAISPDLPLSQGTFHSEQGRLFGAFEDCMPDRWGRSLMLRAESDRARKEGVVPRTLLERDYLLGVDDEARQGALRFWIDGAAQSSDSSGVPHEVRIPDLLKESDSFQNDSLADIHDLLSAGSSLGGARPKASIRDERGVLHIAKFPKKNEGLQGDTCAWECAMLDLLRKLGVQAPHTRLIRVRGRSVLMLERFDRDGDVRIPYLSGLSAIQGQDGGEYSYLELVEFIEEHGSCPEHDLPELWRRILFSCLVGNIDDHMRNHGFLRKGRGWVLSPVFDVNPTPGSGPKQLSCAIDFNRFDADPRVAIEACDYFRVSKDEAKAEHSRMLRALSGWRLEARRKGISAASMDRMASAFDQWVS